MFDSLSEHQPFYRNGSPPEMIYSSTPFRGLNILLGSFQLIREAFPGSRLKVYSSMGVYQVDDVDDVHKVLYEQCQTLEGVDHLGSVGQSELAEAFRRADIMAYPNTFFEMACIAVMEAMASGCIVITSSLGALPETISGHGFLIDFESDTHLFAYQYAQFSIQTIKAAYADPDGFDERMLEQKKFSSRTYTWTSQAQEWEKWLQDTVL